MSTVSIFMTNALAHEPGKLLHSALNLAPDRSAFPWQQDLLQRMCKGELPDALDIPTGLGKTSVMAIWLVARLCGANLPRRLVYVVDRRAVVDQASDSAIALREWIERNIHLKQELGLGDRPLPISTLRGQYVDNRKWLANPSAPAIIVGTVDMVGSRLLFEGYGVSRKMRPYHAGLLGVDTLLVLDEAHLTPPFEHLLRAIATDPAFRPRDAQCDSQVPQFKLLALSATGRTQGGNTLGLTQNDLKHEILNKRLNAKKLLHLLPLNKDLKLEEALAKNAWALAGYGKKAVRVLVYSNSREIALKVREGIKSLAKGDKKASVSPVEVETELFVGSRRVFEREAASTRLKALGFLAGTEMERACPTFLFATSAGEVGVDLDADHMVCDLVAWERMIQRLGRVNRRGESGDHVANVVVLVEPEPTPDKKIQDSLTKRARQEELDEKESIRIEAHERKVREWRSRQRPLEKLPRHDDGSLDTSVSALARLKEWASQEPELRKILDDATSPEPLRPALTLPLVEAWSLTCLKRHPGRPKIQPWLRGWQDEDPQTAIVWRTYLPDRKGGRAPNTAEIEAFFEAAPPHTSEVLETETFRAADWILARVKSLVKSTTQKAPELAVPLVDGDLVACVLAPDGTLRKAFALGDLQALANKDQLKDTLNGATLVVNSRIGGLNDGLLDVKAAAPPLTADGSGWLGQGVVGFRVRSVDSAIAAPRDPNWHERFRFACEISEEGQPGRWLVVDKWRSDAATEDDRSEGVPQFLDKHQEQAERRARDLAEALGLSPDHKNVLTLAARHHDEGKRSERWQRAFHAPTDGVYAKTRGPIDQGRLDGYRHELGSLLRVERLPRVCSLPVEQRDLVLHLIGAHHGFARPLINTDSCDDAPPSVLEEKATEAALRFARLQARWGPWGLAWWEALLRAADQLASSQDVAGSGRASA